MDLKGVWSVFSILFILFRKLRFEEIIKGFVRFVFICLFYNIIVIFIVRFYLFCILFLNFKESLNYIGYCLKELYYFFLSNNLFIILRLVIIGYFIVLC